MREKRDDHKKQRVHTYELKTSRQENARLRGLLRDDVGFQTETKSVATLLEEFRERRIRDILPWAPLEIVPLLREGPSEEEDKKEDEEDEEEENEKDETFGVSKTKRTVFDEIFTNSTRTGDMVHGRRWTRHAKDLLFVLYATSPRAYSLLSELMAVPAVSTLYRIFGGWRRKEGLADDVVIDAILGVDAASFAPTELPGHDPCPIFLLVSRHADKSEMDKFHRPYISARIAVFGAKGL
jgi:hypothetical protein